MDVAGKLRIVFMTALCLNVLVMPKSGYMALEKYAVILEMQIIDELIIG